MTGATASRRLRLLGGAALAIAACQLDTSGIGEALPAQPGDPSADGGADDATGADAPGCDGCDGISAVVTEPFDDATRIDDGGSNNVAVAGGMASLSTLLDVGTGADGACSFPAGGYVLYSYSCSGRAFPDGPSSALGADTLAGEDEVITTTALPGLAVGDELVVVTAQSPIAARIGVYETFRVVSLAGTIVKVTKPAQKSFYATDHVVVQRVPNYSALTVATGSRLATPGWNGLIGGLLFVRVRDTITVAGALDAHFAGYRGGPTPAAAYTSGYAGESWTLNSFAIARTVNANAGGGGAGQGDGCAGTTMGWGGGGGAHATAGGTAGNLSCAGHGGSPYGGPGLLTFGSGGGSGGNDNNLGTSPAGGAGAPGGGVVYLEANQIEVTGDLASDGLRGQGDSPPCTATSSSSTSCWDFSGPGGGGAGGTIKLRANIINLGANRVHAKGGLAGNGLNNPAGPGALGRVFVGGENIAGTSDPPATPDAFYAVTGRIDSTDLLAGQPPAKSFVSITVEVRKRPAGSRVTLLVSNDGATWLPAMPAGAESLPQGSTTVPLDSVLTGGASFYYRLNLDGDAITSPAVEKVTVAYLR